MKNSTIVLIIIGVIVLLLGGLVISTHNSLVDAKESVNSKSSNIQVQLERRADLIPNLVNTVKGYVSHENEVIEKVTSAREKLTNANNLGDKIEANDELTKALNNLFVIVENYPDLKSNENFINLQDELAGTENRIAVARKEYNNEVKTYNSKIKKFPSNIIAGMLGYKEEPYFEAKESANEVPQVDFA